MSQRPRLSLQEMLERLEKLKYTYQLAVTELDRLDEEVNRVRCYNS